MEYIAHRVNTIEQLARATPDCGVELDLRDRGDRLILNHEPFGDGEDFGQYLKQYGHGTMILNIKSERIEPRVLEVMREAGTVRSYFFLDCSFPMIRWLVSAGEHCIAVRFSEYEPIESALALAGEVEWLWVDCFSRMPLDDETFKKVDGVFKVCIVSPELQGHDLSRIEEFAGLLRPYRVDAVCTKHPDLWQAARQGKES